jgi:hypothetical protein
LLTLFLGAGSEVVRKREEGGEGGEEGGKEGEEGSEEGGEEEGEGEGVRKVVGREGKGRERKEVRKGEEGGGRMPICYGKAIHKLCSASPI